MNRTLVLCKPDAVERRLVGEIVGRLERKQLTIVAMELRTLDADRDVTKPKPGARACSDFVVTRDDPFVDVPHTVDAAQPLRTLKLCAPADAIKVERRP